VTNPIHQYQAEDLQTNYINIGPVNKVLNMLSCYHKCNGDISDYQVSERNTASEPWIKTSMRASERA